MKFDDDRVSRVDAAVVAAEAAGRELGGGNSVGAYILQYVRARDAADLGFSPPALEEAESLSADAAEMMHFAATSSAAAGEL